MRTSIARLLRNWAGYRCLAAWTGLMRFVMELVCDLVRREIGPMSGALSILGGGESTVCVTLDLVSRAIDHIFPGWMTPLMMTMLL